MNMDQLIHWFQLNFPNMVKEMRKCSHHYDEKNLNPWHEEGTIFEHTLLVCQQARHSSPVVQMAALLHDIGKPMVVKKDHDKKYTMFTNHESLSAFLALDVLKKVDWLTDDEKVLVFRTIAHHTDPFKLTVKQLNELFLEEPILSATVRETSICDHLGRFTTKPNEEKEFSYNLRQDLPKDKYKSVIVLVGLPNSGKSTRCKQLMEQGYTVLSSDDIVMGMRSDPSMNYNEAWDSVDHDKVNTEFCNRMKQALSHSKVVIDTCNLSKKRRRKLIEHFKKTHNLFCEVMLTSMEDIINRNEARRKYEGKYISDHVYDKMLKSFTCPTLSEGFVDIEWRLN